ncbi:hypothetical protein BQ8482_120117 [Mesorhizobium delmotii]|uniref:Uncharacterized protein n=1 Tax=Mesorhizobium delmotii TaxID=1631247 RepID=A0A2P9AFZ8_9HYPH|nr:hypothetical protein BQ8482_120117 [Mesorhizobium delmotii]
MLEFMPPLTLTEDEVIEGAAIVDQAIADVTAGKVSDADVASFMMWKAGATSRVRKRSPPVRRRWCLP